MNRTKINYFKEQLIKQGKEIEDTIKHMDENQTGQQSQFSPTELSNYDNHPAEIGTELFFTEFNNGLKVHQEHLLKEVHDALTRMDKGTYGKCAFCGRDIGEERLDVLPHARVCIDCEEDKTIDMEILKKDRPVEEFTWDAPFGRKYLNEQEDDEYEGLDYLNDLMKYGSSDTPQDMGGYKDYEEYYTNEVDNQGLVDKMDNVSNHEYKRQLPD